MRVALAQINPFVGDIAGNTARIIARMEQARAAGARLAVFPELAIFGYPPKDLVHRTDLVGRNQQALQQIATASVGMTTAVGFVQPAEESRGAYCTNAAAVCRDGRVLATYAKRLLPTYDVFDERRYFSPGSAVCLVDIPFGESTARVGLTICEDLWNDWQFDHKTVYGINPIAESVAAGATLLINLSASPYRAGIQAKREAMFCGQAQELRTPLIYVNQVGGNDDLVFDGASMAIDAGGKIIARAKAFEDDLLIVDLDDPSREQRAEYPERIAGIRAALVLGLRDYMAKCSFERVLVGLSGGIDSAVTAVLAVDAAGSARVHGVAMPSRFSSSHSVADARALAESLGISFEVIPIEEVHRAMEGALCEPFANLPAHGAGVPGSTVAEENIQARIRGNLLMALSNKSGALVVATGNKSELAVGYCTLYGDMSGGLAVLSDVPKTAVYALARLINESAGRDVIPVGTLTKPPSAELRHDQTDQQSLPPYEILDAILEQYVEMDQSIDAIVAQGFDRATVCSVADMVDRNEYKRKQAAIGIKVTSRAFGAGRRLPIAAKHRLDDAPVGRARTLG